MAKPRTTLVFFFFFLASVCVNGYREEHIVGGKSEVKDVKSNKQVQELGKFSVEEFNRSLRTRGGIGQLRFSQVVAAQKQVVAGMKYYLKIEAMGMENGKMQRFDSVVVIKPWVHYKELLDFSPSFSM